MSGCTPLPRRAWALVLLAGFGLGALGCDDDDGDAVVDAGPVDAADPGPPLPDRFVVAVLGEHPQFPFPPLTITTEAVNAAGGLVDGVPLELRVVDTTGMDLAAVVGEARTLLEDEEVVALIGPETPEQLMSVVPLAIEAEKPVLFYGPSSPDALRAFGGSPYLWRTRPNALAQLGGLVRRARMQGAGRVGLLTSVAPGTDTTYFDWFGFMATLAGYLPQDAVVEGYGDRISCTDAAESMLEAAVDALIITAPSADDLRCLMTVLSAARGPEGELPGEPILADLDVGLVRYPRMLGPESVGLRGWTGIFDETTVPEADWAQIRERNVGALPMTPDGRVAMPLAIGAAVDTVHLVALGLEAAGGRTGAALAAGITDVLSGRGEPLSLRPSTLADALARVRAGERPDISGPSGALDFDPEAGIDPVGGLLAEWVIEPGGARILRTVTVGPGAGEEGESLLRRPSPESLPPPPAAEAVYAPREPEARRLAALLVTASTGWENYRHQADALARYQRLVARGLSHDDIVLIGADDIADHPDNPLPGIVRNVPEGPDVYAGVRYDAPIDETTPERIATALLGGEGPALELDEYTDLYIYLVGHGGPQGIAIGGTTVEEGLSPAAVYTPRMLRETLCTLRAEARVRRVFVEVESCFAGVFGDALYEGLEAGCDDEPLGGVLMLTAANTGENSLGTGYDLDVGTWVGDQFSRAMLDVIDATPDGAWLDQYREVYVSVSGSHAVLYNAAPFGTMAVMPAGDFLTPAP